MMTDGAAYQRLTRLAFPKKHKAAKRRANQSEKGKASQQRYSQSKKGKATRRRAARRYWKSEKGKASQRQAARRFRHSEKGKGKCRADQLRCRYNLTPEEFLAILKHQEGKCGICQRDQAEFTRRLAVDHDHSTRLVRGLLCWHCNSLLPNRKNLIALLTRAIAYLTAPPAIIVIGERLANSVRRRRRKRK